jgi:hypothetical protein
MTRSTVSFARLSRAVFCVGVAYDYQIGEHDVKIGQYTAFLNAVAATDTSSLYNASMETDRNVVNGATTGDAPAKSVTNPNTSAPPTFFIPNENEWYKAAYYSPLLNSGSGGYVGPRIRQLLAAEAPTSCSHCPNNRRKYLCSPCCFAGWVDGRPAHQVHPSLWDRLPTSPVADDAS